MPTRLKSRSTLPVALCAGLVLPLCTAHSLHANGLSELVSPDAKVRRIASGFRFTEGPAWSPQGFLLFSDIPNNRIVRLNADGSTSDWLKPSERANGLMFDAAGNLYACQGGARRVVRITDPKAAPVILADKYDGGRLNSPNDLALDDHGGLYFTDPRYGQGDALEQPVMGVYYVAADGKVSRVIEDLERPNGILVSPDGRWLYVAEPNRGQIFRYRILAPGVLSAGELIFTGDEQKDGRGPDGMAHDEKGNIYATYSGIVVLNPNGSLIGRIPMPVVEVETPNGKRQTAERPANCTFGGPDNRTLFITARTGLYAIGMRVAGAPLRERGPAPDKQAAQADEKTDEGAEPSATREVTIKDITLRLPVAWKAQEPSNKLRLAQFEIAPVEGDKRPAELVVSSFPGGGGGVDPNVQRWIGQFDSDDRTVELKQGRSTLGRYVLVDLIGTYHDQRFERVRGRIVRRTETLPGWRFVGVVLTVPGKGIYFMKLVGPERTVANAIQAFRASFGAKAEDEQAYVVGS